MRDARTPHQHHYGHFNSHVALFAAILLITSTCGAQTATTSPPEAAWTQELQKHPALLTEFGQLLTKLQQVEFPPPRSQSRLFPFLPESTVVYTAFPNYGGATHQALTIFQQELQQSPVLHSWWHQGELAEAGPKIEDALEKVYQLSQFLGDEMVVSVATEGRQGPSLRILAEVRKPGLKDFLQPIAKQLAGKSKPPFRVFDVKELAAAKDLFPPQEPVILVRPDLMVGTLDLAQLQMINTSLDASNKEFVSTPFGQRVVQAYDGGVTVVGAVDLQRLLKLVPQGANQSQMMFRRSGFADMKYLVWDHKTVAGQSASESELSFTGPRRGIASWLAAPGPMGSLDFVSPKAVLVASALLKNPAEIFDDIRDFSTASNPKAFDSITQMETALKVSLREDVLRRLAGEITLEVDSLKPPDPVWKAILQVNDPTGLQTTLKMLLSAMPFNAQQTEEDGITYHTLRIPSAKKAVEIGYAFVDSYLVIGSGQETVAEAVRLHRSGESLAKSAKLLAALPPGHGTEVSGLLYENPTAIAMLSMRQAMPEIAESLSQTTAEAKPVVVCAYGEESALREVSLSSGVDAGAVLVVSAIAIPNLLRARMAANESSAVGAIRVANTAQIAYASAYPQRGYARDLATLGPDPSGTNKYSADHAGFIDDALGNASCKSGVWCTKSGFQFSITAACKKQSCDDYVVVGTPVSGGTGTRNFCSTSDAVIRFRLGPPLSSPVSVSECQRWSPLQ